MSTLRTFFIMALLGLSLWGAGQLWLARQAGLDHVVAYDRGGTTASMQEANAARDILLDELPLARGGTED